MFDKARIFNETDWYGLAGCTSWVPLDKPRLAQDHEQPLIRYASEALQVIADSTAVFLTFSMQMDGKPVDETFTNWECFKTADYMLDVKFPTQAAARLFVDAIPATITQDEAKAMGFQLIHEESYT